MVFSSTVFLFFFLPIVLTGYYCTPGLRLRNICLLFASLFFYAWGEGLYLILMVFSILFNYGVGLLFRKTERTARHKLLLILAVALNLASLGFFKYTNFFIESVNPLLHGLHRAELHLPAIHLPIGISFFTFQAISYIIDVYRKEAEAQTNPLDCGLFIALFPQLIAGPIVRYHDIARQLSHRKHSPRKFHSGTVLFILGLSKKMLLANPLGAVADQVYAIPTDELSALLAWSGSLAYSLQIYFDFSGYSDMAIGLGRMFGFELLINFNYPYIARSFREFWQRWHISLSRWFRDYLYIPLGGNQGPTWKTVRNLWIVFFLCGLWHGASWNFILWGLLHGLFLAGERFIWGNVLVKIPRVICHLYLLLGANITWIFFRTESLSQATGMLKAMFDLHAFTSLVHPVGLIWNNYSIAVFFLALLCSTPIASATYGRLSQNQKKEQLNWIVCLLSFPVSALLFILCAMELAAGTHNPFIYFRF